MTASSTRRQWALTVVSAISAGGLSAQAPPAAFEVVSIKPNNSGDPGMMMMPMQPGGRFSASNVPIRRLILRAYGLPDSQVLGGPSWINSDRFDITAKAVGELSPESLAQMLRSLLAERFHLEVHRESREMATYRLTMARSDGKTGPQLQRSNADCPPPGAPPKDNCGMSMSGGMMVARGVPMAQFVQALSGMLQRPVADRTGLTGTYDFNLAFTPDQGPVGPPPPDAPAISDADGAPLLTAIREQLGLKIEAQKGPVEVVIIDRIERPTEN